MYYNTVIPSSRRNPWTQGVGAAAAQTLRAPEVLKIFAREIRYTTYLFVGVVDTHFAGDHLVQANGHGDDEILGLGDVHPPDERHVGHEPLADEHQTTETTDLMV